MHSMKFSVLEEQASIYASINDYSNYAGLGLSIYKENLEEEWEIVSKPGKYHNYIPATVLTKGNYYLIVTP